jgi:hypothetical protein
MSKCGTCGKEGHNSKTCKAAGAAKSKPKTSPSTPATSTVMEGLIARQKQLRTELAVINRVLVDLSAIGVQ